VRELMDIEGQMDELRKATDAAGNDAPTGQDVPLTADVGPPPVDPDAT
jgi:hypothetical protein